MSVTLLSKKTDAAAPSTQGTAARAGLRIGEPNDSFEQEADRAANEILTGGKPQWSFSKMNVGTPLQRKCDCGGSAECPECKDKKEATLQRKAVDPAGPSVAPPIVHDVLRAPGQPLDAETRAFFEPRFGHDFSQIRVHKGSHESQSARSVNSLAYTVGNDIVFGSGAWQPESARGRRLLAHELAHTIQQSRNASLHGGDFRLQRVTADAAAIPPGMTCVTDPSPGGGAELSITGIKLTGLSAAQKKQVADFYKSWVAAGSTDFIAVEGYASPESANDSAAQQKANWGYSCNRAELVQAEFVKLGVPRSRVITFAHGETDQFSKSSKDTDANRRVNISKVRVAGPPAPGTQQTVQVPGTLQVSGKTDQVAVKQTAPKDVPAGTPAKPTEEKKDAPGPPERLFSITLEFDLKNDWRFPKPPTAPGPKPPFLCDHGVYQLGVKWNNGITVKKDRLEFLNEPELDVNFADPTCGQNPSITAQINLIKFTIIKDVIESDLVGVLGLPDGWATGLTNFPFGASAQLKLQSTPFARLSPDFKGVKVGLSGGLSFEQGVEVPSAGEEKKTTVWTVGGFIGLDYDFGPVKKGEK